MTKPTKRGMHKATKTKAKTINQSSQASSSAKHNHKAKVRKLIPARQAAYYALAFGFSAATIAFPGRGKSIQTAPHSTVQLLPPGYHYPRHRLSLACHQAVLEQYSAQPRVVAQGSSMALTPQYRLAGDSYRFLNHPAGYSTIRRPIGSQGIVAFFP